MIRYKSEGLNTFTIFNELYKQINLSKIEKAEIVVEVIVISMRQLKNYPNRLEQVTSKVYPRFDFYKITNDDLISHSLYTSSNLKLDLDFYNEIKKQFGELNELDKILSDKIEINNVYHPETIRYFEKINNDEI